VLPDKILLYLSLDEFPHYENDLPKELLDCCGFDFQIRWVKENLKSHKKYLYAMEEYPEALVITVDDDIECRNTMVGELLDGHRRFPHAIPAIRCHVIMFDSSGKHLPYNNWAMEVGNTYPQTCNRPSMRLFPTSGAGMLLSPGSLPRCAFDQESILSTSLDADDIWLKVMTVLAGWPTVSLPGWQGAINIEGTQETALWDANSRGGNDCALDRTYAYCTQNLGVSNVDELLQDDFLDTLLRP
jgi:hypothetical protein